MTEKMLFSTAILRNIQVNMYISADLLGRTIYDSEICLKRLKASGLYHIMTAKKSEKYMTVVHFLILKEYTVWYKNMTQAESFLNYSYQIMIYMKEKGQSQDKYLYSNYA